MEAFKLFRCPSLTDIKLEVIDTIHGLAFMDDGDLFNDDLDNQFYSSYTGPDDNGMGNGNNSTLRPNNMQSRYCK